MEIIAAPARQFKTWSMWIAIFIGSFDALHLALQTFVDIEMVTPKQFTAINTALGLALVIARLIKQNIPATTEQKSDMVDAVASLPTIKKGKSK